jgi:hypothetical protein
LPETGIRSIKLLTAFFPRSFARFAAQQSCALFKTYNIWANVPKLFVVELLLYGTLRFSLFKNISNQSEKEIL